MKTIFFLCTGNYYRSRFAEILFNWHAQRRELPWRADSRGLGLDARNPGPISRHTLARLKQLGIQCPSVERFPADMTRADFERADHIVAVKRTEHRPLVERRFADCLELVEFWEVHDLDFATPEEALPQLEQHVLALLDRLAGQQETPLRRGA
jgi:protein-tyrosine phosphatase